MNVGELLSTAEQDLEAIDSARLDAEVLLASCLQRSRASLYAHPELAVSADIETRFRALLAKRKQNYPLAYLLGRKEFWSMDFQLDSSTLIPRPETETLVEQALEFISAEQTCRILDLGTGSGAIAVSIASERPSSRVLAVDVSEAALRVAKENAQQLKITNVDFQNSDWFAEVESQQFDLIVSNPPYVESADQALQDGEISYEPRLALDGGEDGLTAYSMIIPQARHFLRNGGMLLLEHGYQQAKAVQDLLAQNKYSQIRTLKDYAGLQRCSCAIR